MKSTDRIRRLIDDWYDGKVAPAAKAIGIPQRTLAHLYDGSRNPSDATLAKVAAHFRTSTDWLRSGDGIEPSGPSDLLPWSQMDRWNKLVDSLGLRPVAAQAWRQLPSQVGSAMGYFGVNRDQTPHRTPKMIRAMGHELWSWTLALEEWIAIDGHEKIRRVLDKPQSVNAARLGFTWYGLILLLSEKHGDDLTAMIDDLAQEHQQTDPALTELAAFVAEHEKRVKQARASNVAPRDIGRPKKKR